MVDENGKAQSGAAAPAAPGFVSEATRSRPGLEKYALPGPWTEEDEEVFQFVIREFGEGHGGRDADL
jgi:hypothetical protein